MANAIKIILIVLVRILVIAFAYTIGYAIGTICARAFGRRKVEFG